MLRSQNELLNTKRDQVPTSLEKQKKDTRNALKKNNTFNDIVCEVLTEEGNMIRWHGSKGTKETVNTICNEWLRIPDGYDLHSTAIKLKNNLKNENQQTQESQIQQLMNRPHLKCKYIVIVSHPKEYCSKVPYRENDSLLITTDKFWGTDYYKNKNLVVRPEFIKWYFDINNMEFIPNEKYYKRLWEEEQKQLFQEVKKKYMDSVIESNWRLEEYLQIMQENNRKCPYNEKDIEEYLSYTIQEEKLFNSNIEDGTIDDTTNLDWWVCNPEDWE